ncbi:hypothetical protein L1887_31453 [Cichorium endivia]|nr:hypothetical protein L1887_31453 [Cichorium endivia]
MKNVKPSTSTFQQNENFPSTSCSNLPLVSFDDDFDTLFGEHVTTTVQILYDEDQSPPVLYRASTEGEKNPNSTVSNAHLEGEHSNANAGGYDYLIHPVPPPSLLDNDNIDGNDNDNFDVLSTGGDPEQREIVDNSNDEPTYPYLEHGMRIIQKSNYW